MKLTSDADYSNRIQFRPELNVMDIDLSDLTLETGRDVDAFYDLIEAKIGETATTWYFLINYENCQIAPAAWPQFGFRGKRLNLDLSKGSVRYAPPQETKKQILDDSQKESFDPNLFDTREEALARIERMRNEG